MGTARGLSSANIEARMLTKADLIDLLASLASYPFEGSVVLAAKLRAMLEAYRG